jgi:putative ABC transport system permease protein
MMAFLIEALITSIVGGLVGLLLASFLQFFSISTLNFASFSELSFSFALTSNVIIGSLMFSIFMGIAGGFLPALRASRLNILAALRSL